MPGGGEAPVAVRKWQRIFLTSTGICPTLWHASNMYTTSAHAASVQKFRISYT